MTQQGQSNLSGRKSLADGLVHFILGFVYYPTVKLLYPFIISMERALHVIDQLILTRKISFYPVSSLFVEPHPRCLGACERQEVG